MLRTCSSCIIIGIPALVGVSGIKNVFVPGDARRALKRASSIFPSLLKQAFLNNVVSFHVCPICCWRNSINVSLGLLDFLSLIPLHEKLPPRPVEFIHVGKCRMC